jgi:hypothetical protein
MAPELFKPPFQRSPQSDAWAFACVSCEVRLPLNVGSQEVRLLLNYRSGPKVYNPSITLSPTTASKQRFSTQPMSMHGRIATFQWNTAVISCLIRCGVSYRCAGMSTRPPDPQAPSSRKSLLKCNLPRRVPFTNRQRSHGHRIDLGCTTTCPS